MIFFKFCQLGSNNLPLSFSDFFSIYTAATTSKTTPFGLFCSQPRVVLVVLFAQSFFKFNEITVLFQCKFLSFFGGFFGQLQFFFEGFKFFFEFSNGFLDILVLIEVQLLFLLLLDVLHILQLFLQFFDGCVFEPDLVLQLIQSNSIDKYLSTDSVEISLALRSFSTVLYISICL